MSEVDAFSSALEADDFEAVLDQAPFCGIHARGLAVHPYRGAVAAEAKPERGEQN